MTPDRSRNVQVSKLVCEEFSYVLLVTLVLVGGDDERTKGSHESYRNPNRLRIVRPASLMSIA
jgi:hypothetical protein